MTGPPPRFAAEHYSIGTARDGRPLALARMTPDAAHALAGTLPTFGPWSPAHYAVAPDRMAAALMTTGDGASRYQIRCDGALAGGVVIRSPWLAGPYLQLLGVLPAFQGQAIGSRVMAWLEQEAAGVSQNIWLCVSTFNTRAFAFYRAHGFEAVAVLDALSKPQIDETLMRKRLV